MRPACSLDLENDEAQPYFVWDQRLTVAELRTRLSTDDPAERVEWMARLLRDARFDDVWRFVKVEEVVALWPSLVTRLGRRRPFWIWILDRWRADDLVG